jgi:hypothetical protein
MLHVADSTRQPEIKIGGKRWPTIDNANTIWIKSTFDPEFYDPVFLERLWHRSLPDPKAVHPFWQQQLLDNIGLAIKSDSKA